jgi:hypothetical protein
VFIGLVGLRVHMGLGPLRDGLPELLVFGTRIVEVERGTRHLPPSLENGATGAV